MGGGVVKGGVLRGETRRVAVVGPGRESLKGCLHQDNAVTSDGK